MYFSRQTQHTDGGWRQCIEINAGGQTSPVKSSVHMMQLPGEDRETSGGSEALEDWAALCDSSNDCEISLVIVDWIEAEVILATLQHHVSTQ